MSTSANPNRVVWIKDQPSPLCFVPWTGTIVVLADGNVNFCCFSSAIVGNVNHESFNEIWNGPVMTAIRQELTAQRFPPQCRSMSCPLYRGDATTFVTSDLEPYGFKLTGTHDPHMQIRSRLQGSGLRMSNGCVPVLEVWYRGDPLQTDVFAGIQYLDGAIRFLPSLDQFALPLVYGLELREERSPMRIGLTGLSDALALPGSCQISAALFANGSDPNRLSNCYWSEIMVLAAQKNPPLNVDP